MINAKALALISLASMTVMANASFIYGIAEQGGIYKINTATGNSTLVYNSAAGLGRGVTNGLATSGTGTFYYTQGNQLKMNNGTESNLNPLGFTGSNANATLFNNKYVSVRSSGQLRQTDVTTLAIVQTAVTNLRNDFGDIASDSTGMVWSSTIDGTMQKFNLNNLAAGATTLTVKGQEGLQLGFDEMGALFGISYDSRKVFSINLTTGARTHTGGFVNVNQRAININDAASAEPVPEPASMIALGAGALAMLRRRKAAKK